MNKKIIKAVLGGLGISIVLAALFPSAFLTDDAKWTHHGNFGRVDIAFAGDVSDGQIEVQGKSLQVYKLRGLLDKRHNQGVVVQFPASYLKKSHQITLIPRGKGKKLSFEMRFRGEWHRINEQVKPAWVRFENIRLNGNPIAQEKTVWHNKPFIYRTQNVEIGKSLTLNLDIQKPFSFTNIRWERLFGLFILCSLFVFFSYDAIKESVHNIIQQKGIMLSDVGKFIKSHKHEILFSTILTLLANILCIPLWTKLDYGSFIHTLFNKEAQLDLLYEGKTSGEAPFTLQSIPQPLNDPSPFFTNAPNRQWATLNLRTQGNWQKLSLHLKSQRDGKITLMLKGPKVFDDYGILYSVLTDWRNLKINGIVLFAEPRTLSFLEGFTKQIPIRNNDILQIEAEFCRHHFTIHDFTFLKSRNLWYLITGNLLLFFLLLRLFSVFAKRHRVIGLSDALLIIVFFCCLFIPTMDISDGVKSQRENRMLAVKPKMKEILRGNVDTGGGYEKWFNDHFCGRAALVKLHDVIRNKLSYIIRTHRAVYFKEIGWDFVIPFVPDLDCRPPSLQAIVQNLLQLDLFCRQNQIKLYILEVPPKESIYKELIEDNYSFDRKQFAKVSKAKETVRSEVRNHHLPYVYPYNALRNATKQDFVFFKCSHHWTDWGAFVGYCELMKEVCKDFPDIPIASLDDYQKSRNWLQRDDYFRDYRYPPHFWGLFNSSDSELVPLSERVLYNYYDHKNGDKMAIQVGKHTKHFTYPDGKHKIMLLGTSQNEDFLQFLPYSSAQTKYIRLNGGQVKTADQFKVMKLYKKDILSFKPDILILSIHSNDLPRLRDLSSTK